MIFIHLAYASIFSRLWSRWFDSEQLPFEEVPKFLQTLFTLANDMDIKGLSADIKSYKSLAHLVQIDNLRKDLNELVEKEMHLKDIYAFTQINEFKSLDRKLVKETLDDMSNIDEGYFSIRYWVKKCASVFEGKYSVLGNVPSTVVIKKATRDVFKLPYLLQHFAKYRLKIEKLRENKFRSESFDNMLNEFERTIENNIKNWDPSDRNTKLKEQWQNFRLSIKTELDLNIKLLFDLSQKKSTQYGISKSILDQLVIIHLDSMFFK
eukprot:NODE_315_length_9989_cov_0.656825.p6 type:complete len:265 gc:universal NODE_315_length_9989_cov_0.656825:1911-1117(-)